MRQAIIYQRFSTDEQEFGDSIRRQTHAGESFCKKHNLRIVEILLDKGLSAFKRKHLDPKAKFGAFIKALRESTIPKGTVLVFENFDRYSRFEPRQAFSLFGEIIDLGVDIGIVTEDKIYDAESLKDPFTLMAIIMKLFATTSESIKKQRWLNEAWETKRANATTQPMTAKAPFWLKLVDGKFQVFPEQVKVVKLIFNMTIEGHGIASIARELDRKGYKPPMGKQWARTSLSKIIRYKSVIGEYTPKVAGKPVGEPITNYYPPIIDQTTYYAAQKNRKAGFNKGRGSTHVNLFTGLLQDEQGSNFVMVKNNKRRVLITNQMHMGKAPMLTLSYDSFEKAFVSAFIELKPELLKPSETGVDDVVILEGKLQELTTKIETLQTQLEEEENFKAGLTLLSKLNAKHNELSQALETAKATRASTETFSINHCFNTLQLLQGDNATTETRLKARSILKQMVTKVVITPEAGAYKHKRGCLAVITLPSGKVMTFQLFGDGTYERKELEKGYVVINHRPVTSFIGGSSPLRSAKKEKAIAI